jgi:Skp family chaperone for outer membrane proteins
MKRISFVTTLFILLFSNLVFTTSCSEAGKSVEENAEKSNADVSAELEKKKLELQQKELELKEQELREKEDALDKKKEGMDVVESAKRQKEFERANECVVVSQKAYFYKSADPNTKRKAYLVKGDRCTPQKVQNNYIYIEFYSQESEKTTKGWICMDDLEIVN